MKNIAKWNWVGLALIILILVVMSSSCSTTKKSKSVTSTSIESASIEKVDSSSLKTIDSVSVKKDNTVTTVEKEEGYEKETIIEFDTSFNGLSTAWIEYTPEGKVLKTPIAAADYFLSSQPISRITIREKGTRKEKSTIEANTYDSTSKSSKEQIWLVVTTTREVTYRNTIKKKDVVTSGPTFWQKFKTFLFLIIIVAIVIVGQYFKIWSKLWLLFLVIWNRLKNKK